MNFAQVLFEICCAEGGVEGETHHMVVVNVSPITKCHCLLIPEPKSCLPQVCVHVRGRLREAGMLHFVKVLTKDSIRLCLDIVALSNNR